jgi:hypothetical protein
MDNSRTTLSFMIQEFSNVKSWPIWWANASYKTTKNIVSSNIRKLKPKYYKAIEKIVSKQSLNKFKQTYPVDDLNISVYHIVRAKV